MDEQSAESICVIEDQTRCMQCGYMLRGLSIDSSCPECGVGIGKSVIHASGFTARSLFSAGLRFVAIVSVLALTYAGYGWLNQLLWLVSDPYGGAELIEWGMVIFSGLLTLTIAILLWVFAPRIAKLAIAKDAVIISNVGGHKNLLQIASIIFAGWLLVTGLEAILDASVQYLALYEVSEEYGFAYSIALLSGGLFRILIAVAVVVWLRLQRTKTA